MRSPKLLLLLLQGHARVLLLHVRRGPRWGDSLEGRPLGRTTARSTAKSTTIPSLYRLLLLLLLKLLLVLPYLWPWRVAGPQCYLLLVLLLLLLALCVVASGCWQRKVVSRRAHKPAEKF